MSRSDELLLSAPTTYTVDYDNEPHITVNYDRTITIPDELIHIAVEGDHNIETVTFDCPRYWDEHDFFKMKVRINYMRPDGFKDSYPVENLRIDDYDNSMICFDWKISGNVTKFKGNISFLVYIEAFNANPRWHSRLNQQMIVDEGLSCTEQIIHAPDSIEAILAQTTSEYIAQAKTEIDGKTALSLASIPEDYTTVNNMAEKALREKAGAIKMEAEGESIFVNDSSDNYLLGLKVFGKTTQVTTTGAQLFDASKIPTTSNDEVTLTNNNDGSFTISGIVTTTTISFSKSKSYTHEETMALLKAGNITLSAEMVTRPYFYLSVHNSGGRLLELNTADRAISSGEILEEWLNDSSMYMVVGFFTGANAIVTNGTIKPMLYQDGDGTWEEFTDGVASPSPEWPQELVSLENPTMRILGKNVWNHEYDTVDMSNTQGWGTPMWLNDAVITTLLPDTIYTLKFDVTCLSVPTYESLFSDDCGFVLYSSKPGAVVMVMAEDTGNGAFQVGEKRTVTGTFKTPSNLHDPKIGYEIFRYTQRYLKSDGNGVFATVKFENVQLEIGNQATEYTPCEPTQTVSLTRALPGIPVTSGGNYTDSDGQQWVCDEIDFERGVYVQRIGRTLFDDKQTYHINAYRLSDTGHYVFGCSHNDLAVSDMPVMSDSYRNSLWGHWDLNGAMHDIVCFFQVDQKIKTVEAFTAYMCEHPAAVQYILKTPIETALTDAELAQFKMVCIHYHNTTVLNDVGAHMAIKYNADTKIYIDNRIKAAFEDIRSSI